MRHRAAAHAETPARTRRSARHFRPGTRIPAVRKRRIARAAGLQGRGEVGSP